MKAPNLDLYKTRLTKLITESKPFDAVVYRSTTPQYAKEDEILTGEGSRINGGRWNPVGTTVVYGALTPETAMAESLSNSRYSGLSAENAMPRTFVAFHARLQHVLDFRQGDVRRRLQVSLDRILHVDWRKECNNGLVPITQTLGRAAYEAGLEGLLVPSAQARHDANLVVFPANLKNGSELNLLNKDRL